MRGVMQLLGELATPKAQALGIPAGVWQSVYSAATRYAVHEAYDALEMSIWVIMDESDDAFKMMMNSIVSNCRSSL